MLIPSKAPVSVAVLALLSCLALASPLSVHAGVGGPLVQQASGGCSSCESTSSTATFGEHVASGDLIVVGAASTFEPTGDPQSFSVSDTLDSSYIFAVDRCLAPAQASCSGIFYATASSSGADTVTVTVNNGGDPAGLDIFIYELSGVTTAGATTGTGAGFPLLAPTFTSDAAPVPDILGTPVSTTPTSFTQQAFLLGVVSIELLDPAFTAGTGFTASTPSSGSGLGFAEYSLSGVTSPTTFPGTLGSGALFWTESGLALNYPQPSSAPVCPSTLGGVPMPAGATFSDAYGNTWLAPSGNLGGGTWSSYFFAGTQGAVPAPMQQGWGGSYGTYGGQQGWIITFYC